MCITTVANISFILATGAKIECTTLLIVIKSYYINSILHRNWKICKNATNCTVKDLVTGTEVNCF